MPPIIELSIVSTVIIWIHTFYTSVFKQQGRVEPKVFMVKFLTNVGKVGVLMTGLFAAYFGVRLLV
jgi:hypothetical protein